MDKILEKLDTQLKLEKDSIELYNIFIQKIDKEEIRNKISAIKNDEIRHVALVEEMINLIKSVKHAEDIVISENINKKNEAEMNAMNMNGFLKEYSSMAIDVSLEKYPQTIASILSQIKMPCIYLSFNKMPKYTKAMLDGKGVDTSRIKFATCIKGSDESISEPENFTGISIGLEKMMKFEGQFFLFIDSISAFTTYHQVEDIQKFVSFTNSKLQGKNAGVIWMIITDESTSIASKIGQLCDKIVKI